MQVRQTTLRIVFLAGLMVTQGFCLPPSQAVDFSSAPIPSSVPLVVRLQAYLNNLKTVAATFKQVNAQGHRSTGRFYLWRPGLMRLEYDPPSQELIIADGTYITHIQLDLNEVSSVAIDSTPAAILLADHIRLDKDITILGLSHHQGRVMITLARTEEEGEGDLTLVFNAEPLILLEWMVKDTNGRVTHVVLDNIKEGVKLPKELFKIKEKY